MHTPIQGQFNVPNIVTDSKIGSKDTPIPSGISSLIEGAIEAGFDLTVLIATIRQGSWDGIALVLQTEAIATVIDAESDSGDCCG